MVAAICVASSRVGRENQAAGAARGAARQRMRRPGVRRAAARTRWSCRCRCGRGRARRGRRASRAACRAGWGRPRSCRRRRGRRQGLGHAEVEESRHGVLSGGTPQEGRGRGDGAGSRIGSPYEKSRGRKAAKRDNDAGRREPPSTTLAVGLACRLCARTLDVCRAGDETVITFPRAYEPARSVGISDRHPPLASVRSRAPRDVTEQAGVESLPSPHPHQLSVPYGRRTPVKTASRRSPRRTRSLSQVVRETGLLERAPLVLRPRRPRRSSRLRRCDHRLHPSRRQLVPAADRRGARHPVHSGRVPLARSRAPHDLRARQGERPPRSHHRQRHRGHEP